MAQRPVYDNGRVLKYLDHIGVPHSIRDRQDLAALRTLQQHHLARVPFENLSLHYSKSHTVSLDPDELYEKVVIRGRGGYCVEVNCLFATILRSLGFTLYSAGARVNVNKSEVQFNFLSHMVNIVTIDNRKYMVDVGFGGDGATAPLPLEDGCQVESIAPARMRLVVENLPENMDPNQKWWIYQRQSSAHEPWQYITCFTEVEFLPRDYEVINFYTSQSRKVIFTSNIIVAKMIMEAGVLTGTLTMFNTEIKRRIGKDTEVLKSCKSEEDRISALEEIFGLRLSQAERRGIQELNSAIRG